MGHMQNAPSLILWIALVVLLLLVAFSSGTEVAMLSGGRDSVCMLDLAVRVAGADAVTALHVNYGLRDDSDVDERHCEALCARNGVPPFSAF